MTVLGGFKAARFTATKHILKRLCWISHNSSQLIPEIYSIPHYCSHRQESKICPKGPVTNADTILTGSVSDWQCRSVFSMLWVQSNKYSLILSACHSSDLGSISLATLQEWKDLVSQWGRLQLPSVMRELVLAWVHTYTNISFSWACAVNVSPLKLYTTCWPSVC